MHVMGLSVLFGLRLSHSLCVCVCWGLFPPASSFSLPCRWTEWILIVILSSQFVFNTFHWTPLPKKFWIKSNFKSLLQSQGLCEEWLINWVLIEISRHAIHTFICLSHHAQPGQPETSHTDCYCPQGSLRMCLYTLYGHGGCLVTSAVFF